jgi:hypothetical protein
LIGFVVKEQCSGIRAEHAVQAQKKGGFTGAVCAHDGKPFAAPHA